MPNLFMAFKKLRYEKLSSEKMQSNSSAFLSEIKSRRTVRDFSDKKFSKESLNLPGENFIFGNFT